MLRIALVSPPFESVPPKFYGGTERVVQNLCQGLLSAGVDVTLFASSDSKTEARLIPVVDEALRLRRTPVHDPNAYHLRVLSQVASHADEFDLIHNHHDYWLLPLSQMTRTPVLTTLHGQLDLPDLPVAFFSYPDHHYVSISNSQRRPLPSLPWVATIHHGIDTSQFKFYPNPGKYLAFLGRISVEKRPDLAIQIAKESGVPLKIAAKIEHPRDREYYEAFIKPHVDGKFIEYIGEISDSQKSEFLGNALALTFPIDWPEPFGLVMIEALACGTPVLARPCGSVPEILRDQITGFVHSDAKQLARRVADIPLISRQTCRDWVERRFSLTRMTEDYLNVYRHLIDFKKTGRAGGPQAVGQQPFSDRRNFIYSLQRAVGGDS